MPVYIAFATFLLAVSWLLPLHFPPWISWHLELLAFVSTVVLSGGLIVRLLHRRQALIKFPIPALPILALAALAVMQSSLGYIAQYGDAVVLVLYAALCIASMAIGYNSVEGEQTDFGSPLNRRPTGSALEMLAALILVGAVISSIFAFVQVLDVWPTTSLISQVGTLRRPGGNLAQPNQLATLLLMGIASLIFLFESRRVKCATVLLVVVVLIAALVITESRTGALGLCLLVLWWLAKRRPGGFRVSFWAVFSGLLLFFLCASLWPRLFLLLYPLGFEPLVNGAASVNTSPGLRLVVWPQLVDAMMLHPWLGWGLNQVPKAHNAVAHAYQVSEPYSYSHNVLLDLALGMGLPLTIILVGVTCIWLWRRIKATQSLEPWFCVALMLPFALHSMLEFPHTYSYFLAPIAFALGAFERLTSRGTVIRISARWVAGVSLALTLVGAWTVVEYVAIEEDFRVARFEALKVGETPVDYVRPHVILLTQLGVLVDGARIVPRPSMTPDELELARAAALRYPSTATQNRYAMSLALNGHSDEAVRQMKVIRALHGPGFYAAIKANWIARAKEYPQLSAVPIP
ncbi:MAG: Wzy polymerase domain-containing protein [Polaromonas sp.]|nr:Wzy polymerase domain-containing protein [Polaromonas sp.]